VLRINVDRDGKLISSLPLGLSNGTLNILNVAPGKYTIKLSTGYILWTGDLTEKDLFVLKAFPDSDMMLAAATDTLKTKPSKQIMLLDGEIIIQVFPGFEGGSIEIQRLR
jgi:hypothetical protein